MEIIKRNSSLVEYNNCIGDEEVNFVYELNKLDDESWTLYLVDGGISIRVNSENTKGVVQFAPRKKDKTIDIVIISVSEYVNNIYIALAQFLSLYYLKNPFGLNTTKKLSLKRFLENVRSYMSIYGEEDLKIKETIEFHKKAAKINASLGSKVGNFGFSHIDGDVEIYGAATEYIFE